LRLIIIGFVKENFSARRFNDRFDAWCKMLERLKYQREAVTQVLTEIRVFYELINIFEHGVR